MHTLWSDGSDSIQDMADAAVEHQNGGTDNVRYGDIFTDDLCRAHTPVAQLFEDAVVRDGLADDAWGTQDLVLGMR